MNEKLTIQDLTDLLATKHSMTKKDAEAFVKEFFLLIEQALESDKAVKVKGLGTFKLVDVDSRESVNVNTGERFQIKGHTKVTFSPDASLRDTINKPFAHFETVVLNENTILEDTPIEEAEEEETDEEIQGSTIEAQTPTVEIQTPVVEIQTPVVEIQTPVVEIQTPVVEEKKEEKKIEESQQSVEELPEEQPLTETSEKKKEEQEESQKEVEKESELKEEEEKEEEKVVAVAEQCQQTEQPAKKEERITAEQIIKQELQKANLKPELPQKELEQKKSTKRESTKEKSPVPYLIAVIILVLLLCGSVILFIYYPDLFSSSADDSTLEMPSVTTQPIQTEMQLSDTIEHKDTTAKEIAPDIPVATVPQSVAKKEEVNAPAKNTPATPAKDAPAKSENEVDKKQSSTSVYLDSVPYKITGTKTKYTIKEGETLTKVSLRFYGTKAMWPYIVKHNPKVIKNPDNVPYGTTIEIPELTKE